MNSLVPIVIQNVSLRIFAFGIGGEKFLVSMRRHLPVAVDVATAKLQIQMMPVVIVCDRCQHSGLHSHPVHSPDLLQSFSQVAWGALPDLKLGDDAEH